MTTIIMSQLFSTWEVACLRLKILDSLSLSSYLIPPPCLLAFLNLNSFLPILIFQLFVLAECVYFMCHWWGETAASFRMSLTTSDPTLSNISPQTAKSGTIYVMLLQFGISVVVVVVIVVFGRLKRSLRLRACCLNVKIAQLRMCIIPSSSMS